MSTDITKETFEILYNNTYKNILKYTICHCKNLDDANDIIQDVYTDLYKVIAKKKHINLNNAESYLIAIAKNKIKGHFSSLNFQCPIQLEDGSSWQISDNEIDIEEGLITKDNVLHIWNYLKNKSELTAKIFYLYYVMEIPIKTISFDLGLTESNIKNHLYRTQKELKRIFKEGKE